MQLYRGYWAYANQTSAELCLPAIFPHFDNIRERLDFNYKSNRKSQGEAVSVLALKIPEIARERVKISTSLETGDKSEVSVLPMLGIFHVNIFLVITF